MRPARIGSDEGGVALERRIGVVGAQDHPFGKLARDRIGDARLGGIGLGFLAFARQPRSRALLRRCRLPRWLLSARPRTGRRPAAQRLEDGARFEERAAQTDIGLREGCEGRCRSALPAAGSAGAAWLMVRRAGMRLPLACRTASRAAGAARELFVLRPSPLGADSPQAAANAKQMLKRLRPVAFIQPRLSVNPATPIQARPQALGLVRPKSLTNDTEKFAPARYS